MATKLYDLTSGFENLAIAKLAKSTMGAVHIDFATTMDTTLLWLEGEEGHIRLDVSAGRIDGEIVGAEQNSWRRLDTEDAIGADDGFVHSVTLAVTSSGTHLYFDGYEEFSTTGRTWIDAIQLKTLKINPDGVATVKRIAFWDGELDSSAALALAAQPTATTEFAGSELASRDVHKLDGLSQGSIRARFRTRGEGQSGVIVAAEGEHGAIRFGVQDGDLYVTLTENGTLTEEVVAPGNWDDGRVHDVVLVSGHGAIDLYADGYQVVHSPGAFFLADFGHLETRCNGY